MLSFWRSTLVASQPSIAAKTVFHEQTCSKRQYSCEYVNTLLCAHDILLYSSYGNVLAGDFTMAAFFSLDITLLLIYLAQNVLWRTLPHTSAQRVLPLLAVLFLAIYSYGNMAGYPLSPLAEWDKPLMKLTLLCHQLTFLLFP